MQPLDGFLYVESGVGVWAMDPYNIRVLDGHETKETTKASVKLCYSP